MRGRLAALLATAAVIGILLWFIAPSDKVADDTRDRLAVRAALEYRDARARVIRDTVTVTRYATQYRARRDTLVLTDTVQVREFIAVADSTVDACQMLVTSCGAALAKADTLHRLNVQQIGAERRRGRKRALLSFVAGVAVGVVGWEMMR